MLNMLAMIRLGAFRLVHRGARDGSGFLLIGMMAIGAAIWAVVRDERSETVGKTVTGQKTVTS
jgi:hypothetical protein